jgi:tetratricopeptide (TPR) repeat protein
VIEPEPVPAFDHFFGDAEEVSLDDAALEAPVPAQPEFEEFTLDNFPEETATPGGGGMESPQPAAFAPPATAVTPGETGEPAGAGMGEFEEFLAEADFYSQQGLVDEAEFLYSKLLRLSPGHPVVTAQLRKLEAMRAPAQAAATEAAPEAAGLVTIDEALDQALGGGAVEPVAQVPPSPAAPEPTAGIADFSDFLSGLRQELEPQLAPGPAAAAPPLGGEEGLSEIFQEFQRSVKEQLGDEDYETHYNLGIAYKEMSLMEEAVAEFTLAEKSPVRRLNAVSMIALCLREMGRFDEAALKLRTGISLAVEGSEDQKGFLYDLAALHEQAGRTAEMREALLRLLAIDPGYRDVAARVGEVPPAPSAPPRKKSKVSYL